MWKLGTNIPHGVRMMLTLLVFELFTALMHEKQPKIGHKTSLVK